MKKETSKGKLYQYVTMYLIIVLCACILGQATQNQPKYDIIEEMRLIIFLPDGTQHLYDIVEDENGKLLFYIEAGDRHSAYCYIETNTMILDGASFQYQEQYREMFDLLFRYYEDSLSSMSGNITDSSNL